MIDEFNRKNFYFFNIFEARNIDVGSLGNIQEDTVDKEQESFNI